MHTMHFFSMKGNMKDPDVVDFFNEYREVLISPYLEGIIWFMIYDFLIDRLYF